MVKFAFGVAVAAVTVSLPAIAQVTSYGPVTDQGQATIRTVKTAKGDATLDITPWVKLAGKPAFEKLPRSFVQAQPRDMRTKGPIRLERMPIGSAAGGIHAVEGRPDDIHMRLVCDYKGEREYFRIIDVYGPMPATLTAAGPGPDGMMSLLATHCTQAPRMTATSSARTATSKPSSSRAAKDLSKHAAYMTDHGKGIATRDIVQAHNNTTLTTTMSGAAMRTTIWVVLDDGWAVRNPELPLSMIDADAYRAAKPNRWARWKMVGGKPSRQLKSGKWSAIPGSVYHPSPKGRTLDGKFDYHSSGSVGGQSWSGRSVLTFTPDGRYTTSKSSMMSSGVMGSSVYSAGSSGPDGCKRATSVSGGVVGGSSSSDPSCGDGRSGRYEIDGYTLTLTSNSGEVRHVPFYALKSGTAFVFDGKYFGKTSK